MNINIYRRMDSLTMEEHFAIEEAYSDWDNGIISYREFSETARKYGFDPGELAQYLGEKANPSTPQMCPKYIMQALRMLQARRDYYLKSLDPSSGWVYESAVAILEAAITGNKEVLDQFDYYG